MPRKWWVLVSVACGTFMATLDSSIVNIALPTLTQELGVDLPQVKWVVIIYLLVITCLLLPFGRISDQFGRKRVFQLGFFFFTIGSILCGLSSSLQGLVLSRAFQAMGAAMLMANGPAIITACFPSNERGTALGTMGMVVSAGLISGPSIGGILIGHWSWPSIFLVNVPIGFIGIFLVQIFVDATVAGQGTQKSPRAMRPPFDWAGAILQMILLISFIVLFDPPSLSIAGNLPFAVPRLALLAIVVVVGAIFVKVESRAPAPLFDLALLKVRSFWTGNLASFLTFVSFSSVSVLMPFFLQNVLHFSPKLTGVFMTAVPLMIFVVAPISGRLSDRMGSRGLSAAGALIGAMSVFGMAGLFGDGITEHVSRAGIIFALGSVGLATGLFQSPNNNSIMGAVPLSKLGVASALLATIRNLGLVTGTGLATSLFSWEMQVTGSFVTAMHFALFVAGVLGAGAMMASLGKRKEGVIRGKTPEKG
ncbi:MFS transporter [Bdellovibrionota bacterium FG-2]